MNYKPPFYKAEGKLRLTFHWAPLPPRLQYCAKRGLEPTVMPRIGGTHAGYCSFGCPSTAKTLSHPPRDPSRQKDLLLCASCEWRMFIMAGSLFLGCWWCRAWAPFDCGPHGHFPPNLGESCTAAPSAGACNVNILRGNRQKIGHSWKENWETKSKSLNIYDYIILP